MTQRIITGVVGAVLFVGLLALGGLYFEIAVGLLALIALYELFTMKKLIFLSLEGVLASFATLSLALPDAKNWLRLGADGSFYLFAFFVFLMLIGMVFSKGKYVLEDVAFPFICAFYVGLGFQSLNLARQKGIFIVLLAIFIVWSTDIGAYFIGRSFGKHKLASHVSPNKTIEGSLGGLAAAIVVTAIMMLVFKRYAPSVPLLQMLLFALIFSVVSQLGDLVESSIKRHYEVKDSGKILPGHGGILDRFDSMIFVFPIMHIFGLF